MAIPTYTQHRRAHSQLPSVIVVALFLFVCKCKAFTIPSIVRRSGVNVFNNEDIHYIPSLTNHEDNFFHQCMKSSTRSITSTSTSLYMSTTNGPYDKYTIQILMSDTGGGHRASANALRDAFDTLYPNQIECDIVDIFTDYGPFFPINAFVPIYKIMAEYSFLWGWTYAWGATPLGLWFNELFLEVFCFDSFAKCMKRPIGSSGERADMVVSVHPLTQDIPLKILTSLDTDQQSRTKGRTTPFATVVTDLGGAHPTWFNPGVDKCFVPSDALYQCALDRNVRPEQIIQHGLPIRKGFWGESKSGNISEQNTNNSKSFFSLDFFNNINNSNSKMMNSNSSKSRNALRDELGLVGNIPTVLIVGGGDGMGGITSQARAMGKKLNEKANEVNDGDNNPKYQIVVVCGKNAKAQNELMSDQWGSGIVTKINGFVNNMDEWMRASDIIVTKAGPGTIAEASICGLPCMLSSYLPGQEAGNIPFVESAGFGTYSGDEKVIADTVSTWLSSPEILATMKEAALQAARPSATTDIAKDIAGMLFETKNQNEKVKERELVMQ
eukprot:CAMPEP_0184862656 /NCGR_PEP_ID=MMETSP0580-20130426/7085_1 /TAXON_ID=1118495 /ORGANISM="Dactyliosolen fragilissimus" /LENGTH=552 /DNA_ID=CAMNT_0027360609 /DNA_START=44 /DNA_END=1702 /DNA_ORIENTATION=-